MMVTSSVTRSWCRPNCKNLTLPTKKWERSEIHRIQKLSTEPGRGPARVESRHWEQLEVAVGPVGKFIADQLLTKADVIRAMRERVQLCQDQLTEFALFRACLGVSRINHISGCTATQSCMRNGLLKSTMRLDKGRLRGSSHTHRRAVGHRVQEGARRRQSCTSWALPAAKPRFLTMIQDAVSVGLLPEQPMVTRLGVAIEAAAADEAWQQTFQGHNGPTVATQQCQKLSKTAVIHFCSSLEESTLCIFTVV